MLWSPVCPNKLQSHIKYKQRTVPSQGCLLLWMLGCKGVLKLNLLPKLEKPTHDSTWHHFQLNWSETPFPEPESGKGEFRNIPGQKSHDWLSVRLEVWQQAGFEILSQALLLLLFTQLLLSGSVCLSATPSTCSRREFHLSLERNQAAGSL